MQTRRCNVPLMRSKKLVVAPTLIMTYELTQSPTVIEDYLSVLVLVSRNSQP